MLKFDANMYRLAFLCTSKDETRYYLQGVLVEPHAVKGVTLTATDGHRLVCIYDENGQADESAIIKLSPDALKACKPKRDIRIVTIDGNSATVSETTARDGQFEPTTRLAISDNCRVDGTFPDWRRVVPQSAEWTNESRPGCFNAEYLAAFGKIAEGLSGDARQFIRVLSHDPGGPALVLFSNASHAFGVIMPVRGDKVESIPEWFNAKAEMKEAAE